MAADPRVVFEGGRRKREKWCTDPRNTKWSNDSSRFGFKMLEKMGWSQGKGLGLNEDGLVDHTKQSVKSDTLGLGAKRDVDEEWVGQQADFDRILAELGQHHQSREENGDTVSSSDNSGSARKERKEKRFRPAVNGRRLKYSKVLRSKDLSDKKERDLDCILGRKKTSRRSTPS